MYGINFRKGLALLVVLFLVFSIGTLWAGGSQETDDAVSEDHHHDEHDGHDHEDHDHDHHDEHHHEGEMAIPHIEPADLGAGESLRVVASTSIVGDVVLQIAGSAATVDVLMAIGQNPHSYEPTPRDIIALEESYIAFVNGLNLEEELMETIETVAGTYVVPVSAGIAVIEGGEHDHDHEGEHDHDHDEHHDEAHHDEHEGEHDHDHDHEEAHHDEHGHDHDHAAGDPHFWFDPTNVIVWAQNIAEALSEADPSNTSIYEANRDAYIAELEALDLEIRQQVASIPRDRRKLVVDHAALGYYAEEYGFEVIGEVIPSVSDQAEPSARHIAELAEVIREEDASAIFIGGTAGRGLRNLVDAVAAEVGRDVQVVEILTGSLAPEGSPGDTYLEFVRFNTEQIVAALSR
ncbi:MAG: metal ABC transporter substrate-binding protein [Spirochaetales bacterium]|nr:metal ABC transporter substrate-binding protein [Spirochaetales bacterium]